MSVTNLAEKIKTFKFVPENFNIIKYLIVEILIRCLFSSSRERGIISHEMGEYIHRGLMYLYYHQSF